MSKLLRIVVTFAAALLLGVPGAHAQTLNDVLGIIPPLAPGPYPVGCSNVEQDFSRVMGSDAAAYWEGRGASGTGYVTDLLVDRRTRSSSTSRCRTIANCTATFATGRSPTRTFVCYPTTTANNYADYALPNGKIVPRMQRGGQPPILHRIARGFRAALLARLRRQPHFQRLHRRAELFASHGYVVVAPFMAIRDLRTRASRRSTICCAQSQTSRITRQCRPSGRIR
jgi:hypothetical protein